VVAISNVRRESACIGNQSGTAALPSRTRSRGTRSLLITNPSRRLRRTTQARHPSVFPRTHRPTLIVVGRLDAGELEPAWNHPWHQERHSRSSRPASDILNNGLTVPRWVGVPRHASKAIRVGTAARSGYPRRRRIAVDRGVLEPIRSRVSSSTALAPAPWLARLDRRWSGLVQISHNPNVNPARAGVPATGVIVIRPMATSASGTRPLQRRRSRRSTATSLRICFRIRPKAPSKRRRGRE
jgi:hypothetical protein